MRDEMGFFTIYFYHQPEANKSQKDLKGSNGLFLSLGNIPFGFFELTGVLCSRIS